MEKLTIKKTLSFIMSRTRPFPLLTLLVKRDLELLLQRHHDLDLIHAKADAAGCEILD